ncbi:carboxyl-terminal processing protease [Pullulanibacillus pueri]|uniref:Peptidase S41 n=1 Tax=Pullulanibacillus pueri TaxID=1437324 RepID=A0A8J3A359_9BACL|nr:S41 family peptidase [Pullulanibacillus pueri]MBM7684189.1 carboxyl-terminal processing protease [Pullulanibacillus pueri]GGH88909.1 peptidase S41 [Pullulanibacillus pueri]
MKFSGKVVALLVIVALLVGASGAYGATRLFGSDQNAVTMDSGTTDSTSSNANFKKMEEIFQFINQRYYKKVDEQTLTNGAIQGMIESLDDPFSSYMDPDTASQFNESLSSSFQGIGAEVQLENNKVTVVSPIKGSPAEKAGLQPHDQIVSVNGKSLEGMSLNEAVAQIKGKEGTVAHLVVERKGVTKPLEFDITRKEIPLTTASSKVFDYKGEKFGYLDITSFNESTSKEFSNEINKLEKQNIKGLVIDVRGNPGGYLDQVEKMANEIVSSKKPIVQIQDRNGKIVDKFNSTLEQKKPYPIVGLIDSGSASAAEILSAALKEAGGYPLVGVKSFGKGTVQQAVDINDTDKNGKKATSELKLTMFKWLTPDGNWIHKKGIQPTMKVEQPDYFFTSPMTVDKKKPLKYDMNNEQIANAQKMLKGIGYNPGRTDGYFDEDTQTAVRAFQKANDLTVNGQIDSETAGKIQEKVLDAVNDPKNDLQLQAAFKLLDDQLK